MRFLLALAAVMVGTIACSNNPSARTCLVEKDARPKVAFAWKVAHGSMDDDPPRARVKLAMTGAASGEVDVGELEGICKLGETGSLPEQPPSGSKVTELECKHGDRDMVAAVVYLAPGKLSVRRYERNESEPLKNLRALSDLEVPSCVAFSAEVSQAGDL